MVGIAVTMAEGVAAIGVENENVGRAPEDGSTVATNENVGYRAMVDSGAAVAVGAIVGVAGI